MAASPARTSTEATAASAIHLSLDLRGFPAPVGGVWPVGTSPCGVSLHWVEAQLSGEPCGSSWPLGLVIGWGSFRIVNGQQELPIDGHEISPLADTRTPHRRTGFLPSGRSSDQRLHPLAGESLF